jgi:hypothetical protein
MRFLGAFVSVFLFAACTAEKRPEPAAAATTPAKEVYGQVSEGPAVQPSEILARIDAYAGKVVRVEGTVAAVCKMRGCWMDVAGADGAKLRIKVRDGQVVFPTSAVGKRVIAEGVVVKIPLDPASDDAACGSAEHHAESAAHEECARPAGATARIDGTGAVVL